MAAEHRCLLLVPCRSLQFILDGREWTLIETSYSQCAVNNDISASEPQRMTPESPYPSVLTSAEYVSAVARKQWLIDFARLGYAPCRNMLVTHRMIVRYMIDAFSNIFVICSNVVYLDHIQIQNVVDPARRTNFVVIIFF